MIVKEQLHALQAGYAGAYLAAYEAEGMPYRIPSLGPRACPAHRGGVMPHGDRAIMLAAKRTVFPVIKPVTA